MNPIAITAAIVGGVAVLGAAGATVGAYTLYKKVIPRQDQCRVNLNEMADMQKWEVYKEIIHTNKDWLGARESEHITIKANDGITLHADLYLADNSSDKLVICSHGYTTTGWDACSSIASYFVKKGFDCLIVDNRAHGKSEGDYVGFGILDRFDCLKWINYINERFENKKNILLYGVSMGAATVVMTSGFKELPSNVKGIISDCAFTSPFDVFSHIMKRDYHMGQFPVMNINNLLCKKNAGYGFRDYSTLDAVKATKCPILFIHGAEDNFVPTYMSNQNYDACNSPKELLIVENAGHAASYYENAPLYEKTIEEFIDKYIPEIK